jgi:diguanylate cyclase (GGDEF)-like protein
LTKSADVPNDGLDLGVRVLKNRVQPVILAASLAVVVFATWLGAGWGGPDVTAAVSALGSLGFSTLAFGCALTAAIRTPLLRGRAWLAVAVGLFGWVVGDAIWACYGLVLHAEPPSPSIADVAYLVLPVGTIVAFVITASARRLVGLRPLIDGLIITSSLFLVSWVVVLRQIFAAYQGSRAELATSLAYAVADVFMVAISVLVLTSAPPSHRRVLALVTAGLTTLAITDSLLVYLNAKGVRTSDLLVVGWAVGLVLLSAGALLAIRNPDHEAPGKPHSSRLWQWLPYVPMAIAAAVGLIFLSSMTAAIPVLVSGGVLVGAALVRQLIMLLDNRTLLDAVADQALRDPLTGLANRLLFSDRLNHAMEMRDRDGRRVAVLSLDLDEFKLVNDNLGHPAGDALLRAVAERLVTVVPTGDTVARLGGDEFAILIEDGPQPAETTAQRVVEVFDKAFFLEGEEVFMHPSVGLAVTPGLEDDDVTADELFRRADIAMYAAKRAGVGGVQTFTADMRHVDRTETQSPSWHSGKRRRSPVAGIQLLGQLRRAIDDDELDLVYQPKISLTTGNTVGVEALVRWPHPEFGVLTPNQFLPLVRQNGLMGAVTDLVLYRAAHDAVTWYDAAECEIPVAINLFAPSLNDLALPDRIAAALDRTGLPPAALSVEITEHLLLANIRRAGGVIQRLRADGIRIAIDDFGSGYATMSYLRDLPIDELKLDRQFIAPVLRSERAAAIVQSVIDLAHALGIACVAEGVENGATANWLREAGCDVAQGHYFARPMAAEALRERCQLGCSNSAIFPITN